MPTSRVASVYADTPVYAAGRSPRPYTAPGAATHRAYEDLGQPFLRPALIFVAGAAAGVLVAVAIVKAVMR